MNFGRQEIFTDEKEVTAENVLSIVQNAMPTHEANAFRMTYLLNFEAGNQPLQRVKLTRQDIDTTDIDNVANEIAEFKVGFNWGNPITLVQRGETDNGTEKEANAIALLNEQYATALDGAKQQQLARFVEICGVGYDYIDINTEYDEEDNPCYFTKDVLDPRHSFVVKSNYYTDKRVILGVTYAETTDGNKHITAWSKNARYEISGSYVLEMGDDGKEHKVADYSHRNRSGELNPLGMIPIIEWVRSYDRMGCFERQIDELNALNILASDMINASSEQVDCIWHTNDIEFPTDENGEVIKPKTNDWIQTFTSQDGKTPFITPLSPNYDYNGNLQNYTSKRAMILQKCNVPCRNDNSGGSTGIAMSDATGWSSAETSASKQQLITEGAKMQEVRAVLRAIKKSPYIKQDNPLMTLTYMDVQPNIKRNKSYELTTKSNALATLISHGVDGLHAIKAVGLFDDDNQVWEDSKELIEKYQKSIFEKQPTNTAVGGDGEKDADAENTASDNSDQIENSPMLDSNRG